MVSSKKEEGKQRAQLLLELVVSFSRLLRDLRGHLDGLSSRWVTVR